MADDATKAGWRWSAATWTEQSPEWPVCRGEDRQLLAGL